MNSTVVLAKCAVIFYVLDHLVPNLSVELYFVIQLLTSRGSDADLLSPVLKGLSVLCLVLLGLYIYIYIIASELNDPICHSDECQIGSFSSEETMYMVSSKFQYEKIPLKLMK